jgi:hypothetical protein
VDTSDFRLLVSDFCFSGWSLAERTARKMAQRNGSSEPFKYSLIKSISINWKSFRVELSQFECISVSVNPSANPIALSEKG